jgi:hypothetical protein
MKNLTTEEITKLTREVNEGRRKMRSLTLKEELEEELFDLAITYEGLVEGLAGDTTYAEELYEELVLVEGMLRSAEAAHGEGKRGKNEKSDT